jgi:DNA integrity scanning protein DisA with diadenylate cyclase activity
MSGPLYPAARVHAPRIEEHFARHLADAGQASAAAGPDAATIEALVDAAFWASLQREEGYLPEISLAFLPPDRAVWPMLLKEPLPLGPRSLARLAPAVERPGIHLGVWRVGGELRVWGTTRAVPTFCMVVEVVGPGLLVVKHRVDEESAKFRNVAVFEGEQVKLMRWGVAGLEDAPALLRHMLGPESSSPADDDAADVLLRLAVSMRAHKRGGTLLVVPAGTESWRASILRPIAYEVHPPFSELAELVRDAPAGHLAEVARVVEEIAGLTAVDGATVITDRFELLAFGVKIGRPDGRARVERVMRSEPVEGGSEEVVVPLQLGGTRHNSAAQFTQDQRDAFAMVASQDGRFTLMGWSEREDMVRAHRVEALLL